MPIRKVPLVTQEVYHVLNRGVAHAPIFTDKRSYNRFLQTLDYYRFSNNPTKLSHFLALSIQEKKMLMENLEKKRGKLVEIFCYCLMTNHFHLLIRQLVDKGISTFIGKAINSYSRYFNIRNDRVGPLLQGRFKAVRVETDEQFIHVSRYIHINPYVGRLIEREELKSYPYSSLSQYVSKGSAYIVDKELLASYFSTPKEYEKFVFDEADYQASREQFKHLILE